MAIFYRLLNAFTVSSLDATYIVRIDEEIWTDWASDFDPMSDAIMKISRPTGKQRITLVSDPFKEHSCSDKELCVLEGVFPGALAVDIADRIRKDNVQLWFARDIMSYAAKHHEVI